MKKFTGFSTIGVIIGVALVALLGAATFAVVDANNKSTDFSSYDFNTIIEASKDNGNIGDHVKGNPDAPVLIFEYADYQCPGCASINPKVNKAIEKADGKLAIVYRSYLLAYHQNGTAAASAAEAAGLQGYWKEYANKLFAEQAEWEGATGSERSALFEKYFDEVSNGKGDMDKFREDLGSDEVSKKISFDMGVGKRVDIQATPAFYVDGQWINWSEAGSVTVDGEVVEWDSARGGDEFVNLLLEIVEAKTGKKE